MSRWSLKNIFKQVTHTQFIDYTNKFKQAAEYSFGTECSLRIRALTQPKACTTFKDKDILGDVDFLNKKNTISDTNNLNEVTSELWAKARYVEVIIRPKDQEKAPEYAFGHAEFKGEKPRQATFYIHPNGQAARESLVSAAKRKFIGDGFGTNGTISGVPSSAIRSLGLRF